VAGSADATTAYVCEIHLRVGGSVPDGAVLHLALRTANCDAALAQAVAAGAVVTMTARDVTIPSQPQPTPVRIAFCRGLAGEIIEFFQNELT
jgi:glyoxylase I family protein